MSGQPIVYLCNLTMSNIPSRLEPLLTAQPESLVSGANYSSQQLPHYLIFELGYTGHYPHYIRHLAQFWSHQRYPGKLTILVSPQFAHHHAEVLAVGQASGPDPQLGRLRFKVLSEAEADQLVPRQSPLTRAQRSLQEWALLQKYVQSLQVTHALLLYFDSFQTAVLLKRPLSCLFSGIYFRPTLHYCTLGRHAPTAKSRVQSLRERVVLPRVVKHPQFQHLFCLDPYFVEFAQQRLQMPSARYLPDPVVTQPLLQDLSLPDYRQKLGIEAGRTTFLLFGALYDRRKGIEQVLDAITQLSKAACQKVCLLLVGQLGDGPENFLQARIQELRKTHAVQVIICNGFVPDEEVSLCFQVTDIVLAPYQRHVGMSGILVHAAAAQKPLIASNYGLLGELVSRLQLGITVDTTVSAEIAMAMDQCVQCPAETIGNRQEMLAFARQNSALNFAHSIFQALQERPKGCEGASW